MAGCTRYVAIFLRRFGAMYNCQINQGVFRLIFIVWVDSVPERGIKMCPADFHKQANTVGVGCLHSTNTPLVP